MRYWKKKATPGNPEVLIVAALYLDSERLAAACRCFVESIRAQTYAHWRLVLVHDGPLSEAWRQALNLESIRDSRVKLVETPVRRQEHGHPWRRLMALRHSAGSQYVCFTNCDNYYAPVFLEWSVSTLLARKSGFTYCDMVRSHKMWQAHTTRPEPGRIDLGSAVVGLDLVKRTEWTDYGFRGDGIYLAELARLTKPVRIPACVFVHN